MQKLVLPKRYEALEREARDSDLELSRIIQRIDTAANRIENLLRQVRDGGLGRFELVLGKSGSGKTTFFRTLQRFFEGIRVASVPNDVPLTEVANHIRAHSQWQNTPVIWVMYDRDNPAEDKDTIRQFCESLRVLFREDAGRIVLCWPITDEDKAREISDIAWAIGRDSVVDLDRGVYNFTGVPKQHFYDIADITSRSLRGGSLEVFGLTKDVAEPLAVESQTIAEFYTRLEQKSAEINEHYREILKDKTVPSVWILVGGDDARDLNLTIATLTQGTQKQVDIDRLLTFLDDPELDAGYLKEWKKRRAELAYLMRLLDVRIFELPPNVALAAVRAHGSDEAKRNLKLKTVNPTAADSTFSNAGFVRAIKGEDLSSRAYLRTTEEETANEYRRLQSRARGEDKKFNKALGNALSRILEDDNVDVQVASEVKAPQGNLKPDIRISFSTGRVICLEPTWRSTGKGIEGELESKQNTLTVGHIQKYLLEKVLNYVKDLNI
ncbi:MAG: hypothetical protein R3B84_23845 [Zavarzinella sp.]